MEALVATAVGLAAAIPAVWFTITLPRRMLMQEVRWKTLVEILNLIERTFLVKGVKISNFKKSGIKWDLNKEIK